MTSPEAPLPFGVPLSVIAIQLSQGIFHQMPFTLLVYMVQDFGRYTAEEEEEIGKMTGILASLSQAGSFIASYGWGLASDSVGRKPVIVFGCSSAAVSLIGLGLSNSYAMACVVRLLGGILNGIIGALKTAIAELTDDTNKARGMSYLSMGWGIGGVLGPLIGGSLSKPCSAEGLLLDTFLCPEGALFARFPYLLPCLVAAAVNFLAAALSVCLLPETLAKKSEGSAYQQLALAEEKDDLEPIEIELGKMRTDVAEGNDPLPQDMSANPNTKVSSREEVDLDLEEGIREWYRDRQCILCLCGYGIIAFTFMVLDEAVPVYAAATVHAGGLALPPAGLAGPLMFGGVCLFASYEEKPGESSLRDIALSVHQEQISALTEMMKGLSAQLYDMRSLNHSAPCATVPVDQHLNSSPAGGRRPLPSLSDMTKGLSADSYFSGKETDQEGIWDEWLAKVKPSLRHPSLALLLSESTPLHMVRGDDLYLEEANHLFYDFLCRVTTGTANAVVRSYEQHSDGHGAWLELSKLRRNTSVVYFITQVDKLLSLPNQLSRLAPPLPTFLESKETLRRVREYSANARVTPSGKPLCMETVETIFSAMAIVRVHPDYMLLKAKFMSETLPTASVLSDQVKSHYDTILAPRAAVAQTAHALDTQSETAGAIADDRRKQEEAKRKLLAVKVPCPVCHRRGHPAKDCFIKNIEKREAFFKKASPTTKAAILKRVADYEKHGSLPKPGEHLGAAAGQSELHPGPEEAGEVLFAIREAGPSDLHPGLSETGEDIYASYSGSGLLEFGRSSISGLLTLCPASGQLSTYQSSGLVESSLLDGARSAPSPGSAEAGNLNISGSLPSSSAPCEPWISGRGSVPVESQSSVFPVFNYYSVLTEVGEPEVVVSHTAGEYTGDNEGTVSAPRVELSSVGCPPRRARKKHHCYVPNKHSPVLSRRHRTKVVPIYDSWVYIDVLTAFFPDKARLKRTQAQWDDGRDQHLGDTFQISPRQLWFKPELQRWHSIMMAGSVEIFFRAHHILDKGTTLPRGVEHTVSAEKILCQLRIIRQATDDMDILLKLESVMVRTSLVDLHSWASELGGATRALIQVVEDFGGMLSLGEGWGTNAWPEYSDSGSDDDASMPDLEDASDSDEEEEDMYLGHSDEEDMHLGQPVESDVGSVASLVSGSSDGDSLPDLEDASDSDEEEEGMYHGHSDEEEEYMSLGQPVEGVGYSPFDDWASGLLSPPRKIRFCSVALLPSDYYEDHCESYYDDACDDLVEDLDLGSDPRGECAWVPCDTWASGMYYAPDAGHAQVACGASAGSSGTQSAVDKSAVIDNGATKHIFNSVRVFNADYDSTACETCSVVQSQFVSSSGSGSPFNLLSVVALEDASFLVDFGARTVSKGGVVFSFARVGNQYIMHEDTHNTLDTHLACVAKHTDDQRDRSDWKFEDTKPHFTTHGPFLLELFSSDDNHILDDYCTITDTCFGKDWAGKHCYGNPPFDHAIILQCLQKALTDFDRDPSNAKFMFILPKWVTASWWSLVSRFDVIHEYPAGAKIFSAPRDSCYNVANLEPCGEDRVWIEDTKWPVMVLFKDSHTTEQMDIKLLQHVRLGHVGDKPVDHMFAQSVPMPISESQYSGSPVQHRPERWFVLFVDDSTTWICIFFLKLKCDYLKAFQLYLQEVKRLRSTMNLSSEYHMVLHTDGDSTMIAGQTAAFCEEHGIEQRHGSPYLHENQARVERSHRDVQAMARALLLTSGFDVDMWPLATRHAVYILNRVFRKSLGWTSAYYLIRKKHADLSQLRVFGCMAYPFIDPTIREHKLSNRARELRYVGHSEVSSAYLLYDCESGKVVNSGMVTFSERLDKLGKVVTTWDPSAVTPLKTNFMVTTLDAPYRDPPLALLETAVLEQGVYLPEDSDEIVAVVKVETSDDVCWRSDVEPCLYFIRDTTLQVIILAYVDDYLVATNDKSWYDTFVASFHAQYACKDLGVLDLVMGIGVRWGSDTADLSQSGHVSQIISTYGLDDAKPASLPMSPGTALAPTDGKGPMPYRALLGQLQWVARCSRPDIMAVVSVLSRFCATYGPEHFVALKQVVRYLKGTREYELVLRTASVPGGCGTGPSRPLPLSIYTDADYAGCKVTRRSTSGIAVFLCGSLIIFSSMIQKCVSLSTTEAEIIAMSEGAREVKYVLNVLDSLVDICRPVPMYCDNQGAIHLATDYVNNSRSKHIEVRNMYIRELVKAKDTEALYTGTDDNTFTIFGYPPLDRRYGARTCVVAGTLIAVIPTLLIPAVSLLLRMGQLQVAMLGACMGFKNMCATCAFTSSIIMVNTSAPDGQLGRVNGAGQTISAFPTLPTVPSYEASSGG
ncbi:hypothetical protein CYMTET_52239 [Cymbomonas tetramitiformis]|uniref:Integrase catalytic domain-containing protein n=1 Tax=Cymbomonas tetramitiformis TaxID=36881 RepID=A0AAE0BL85_9CHLO|nr:hypothetical protein CYMTET_52239 [Cymbomonas tetramitiformis]